jgi:hypothetical protein
MLSDLNTRLDMRDRFQDILAEIAIGVVLMFVLAAGISAGLRAIKVLDDGGAAAPPSAWQGK